MNIAAGSALIFISVFYWIYLVWQAGQSPIRKVPTDDEFMLFVGFGVFPAFLGLFLVFTPFS